MQLNNLSYICRRITWFLFTTGPIIPSKRNGCITRPTLTNPLLFGLDRLAMSKTLLSSATFVAGKFGAWMSTRPSLLWFPFPSPNEGSLHARSCYLRARIPTLSLNTIM